jgi:hypothetical protein
MNQNEYLRIYVALRTADPRLATAAIATLRLSMTAELGEEVQRSLVQRGNAVEVVLRNRIPFPIYQGYCETLFRRAGLTSDELHRVSHLLSDFAPELLGDEWPDPDALLAAYQARLDIQDWHNARLTSNHLLAFALMQGDVLLAEKAVRLTIEALNRWPEAREDRPYEFAENEWILAHLSGLVDRFQEANELYQRDRKLFV